MQFFRRSLGIFPLLLLFATESCGANDLLPTGTGGESGAAGNAGAGGTPGLGGAGPAGSGGTAGAATGGAGLGTGGSAFAGAGSGGVAGASAGAGIGGSAGSAVGDAGAGLGGLGGGGVDQGGAGSGGAVNGGNGGKAGASGQGGAGQSGSGGRGGAGTGGSAGGGGASGFNPCPATGACKILPLGDSITDGLGVPGGGSYRIELFHLALAAGEQITYVGGSMNGPMTVDGQMFPRSHEGHSGWTIAQIDGIVPSPALGPDPHIVLLHIGTNDLNGGASGAPARLGTLIDQITADLPNSLLVVAKIIPFPGATTFNDAIPALVQARANAGKHVIMVDQFTGFPTSELADGVHPNAAGYARMARVWYAAISSYIH